MTQPSQGVFYVATGEKHRRLTGRAIASLRQTNPALPISVFTDEPEAFSEIRSRLDRILLIPEPSRGFHDKIFGFINAPYDRCVFLDSDTTVVGDIRELFDILEQFDFAAAHAPGHSGARIHDYESKEIPSSFVQFNTGVVCFRRTPAVLAVFANWQAIYRNNPQHRHDQPGLRAALYQSSLRLHTLPPEYNLLPGIAYVSGPVKIIHSAAPDDQIRTMEQALNSSTGPRIVLPNGKIEYLAPPPAAAPKPATSGPPPAAELHLFILWEAARPLQPRILEDLQRTFELVDVRELRWSAARVSDNFTRFYGQKLPPGSFKEEHCGKGAFLVVLARDRAPRYENRQTSKGERRVNINTFDAKQRYREWTGGGHRIHATDTEAETRHDFAMLFGTSLGEFVAAHPLPWDGKIASLAADLAGAEGWSSLRQFFSVLNETARFLVLRNFEWLPDQYRTAEHGDIDLLTDSVEELVFVANARKVFPEPWRIHYTVRIGSEEVVFDFRHVGDDYYDVQWEKFMLAERQPDARGFPVLPREDYFYSLLYHALVHKPQVAADYVDKLARLAADLKLPGVNASTFAQPRQARRLLDVFLQLRGYTYSCPKDLSVHFNAQLFRLAPAVIIQPQALSDLPALRHSSALLSARTLAEHAGVRYSSLVHEDAEGGGILKQATADLAWRDAQLLRRLNGPHFPRVLDARQENGWSVARFERIDGYELGQVIPEVAATPETLATFFGECLDILEALQTAQITHRDLQVHNFLVRDGKPVLIDFGWATAPDLAGFEPPGLGDHGRPPDGSFCDAFALGKVFAACRPANDTIFSPLIDAMTQVDPQQRIKPAAALRQRLRELVLPAGWPQPPVFLACRRHFESPPWQGEAAVIFKRAGIQAANRDLAAARIGLEDGLLAHPKAVELRLGLVQVLEQQNEPGRAEQQLALAIQQVPETPVALAALAGALLEMKRAEDCQRVLKKLLKLSPGDRPARTLLAALLLQAGNHPDAARHYAELLRLNPKDVDARILFGTCCFHLKDLAAARNHFEAVLQLQPQNEVARENLQVIDAAAGEPVPPPQPCPVCRQPAKLKISKRGHDYFNCAACGTVFTPKIDPAAIRTQNNANASRHDPAVDFWRLGLLEKACQQPVRKLVDFGCGQGEFTALMRQRGIQCEGIDQDTALQLRDLPDGSLDGITMVEVIEHLYDPHPVLQEFQRVLRPGGAVFVESSFVDGQELAGWPYLDPAIGHCTIHTEPSMHLLAAAHGFDLQKLSPHIYLLKKSATVTAGSVAEPASLSPAPAVFLSGTDGAVQVSVIIPVFNQLAFTKQCLAQLAATPSAVAHEIILVDDHSTDETEAFCREQVKTQPNLRYHRLPENRGFGRACNHGAKQARGQWLVFLNNDTQPQPGWLEAGVARLQSDPAIGIVGAKLLYPDRKVQHCGIEFFWGANPEHAIWPLHRHMGVAEHDPRANGAGEVPAVTGACLFIAGDLFRDIGGFSPEYPMYFEDTDLCFKVRQAGRKVFYEPQCVVIHHESRSSPSREKVNALNRQSGAIFFRKWSAQLDEMAFEISVERSDGRFIYLRPEVLPRTQGLPPDTAKILSRLFHRIGPFYMHFGGAGDALLLLSTFLDRHPDAQVISFPNSIPAMRSFFEAFPTLKRVWFLPVNDRPEIHLLLRMMMRHCPNFRGMGITPEGDYFKDWNAGLDIFRQLKVSRHPDWIRQFRTEPRPRQVVLAPKGSLCGMAGSKQNIIHPSVWPQLLRFLIKKGFDPVLIGTPDERKTYPGLKGCDDRRSHSFREQMELIANSAMVIGADSWAKTFSALAGIPTLVFEPIKGADWNGVKDPAEFIFLDPWPSITIVKDLEQCSRAFERLVSGSPPAEPKSSLVKPVTVSWEGSFLDHGSLSYVNRELTAALKTFPDVNCTGVSNGAPASPGFEKLAQTLSPKRPAAAAVTVRHAWPPDWRRPQSGKLVVIQPWEFGSLPEQWVKDLAHVDECWVPSEYVRKVYVDSGVPADKVVVVPNGVSPERFNPQVAPMKLATRKQFKFLFVGGTIFRKGPDLLLKAFLDNFTAADDVCLVIKDFGGQTVYAGQTVEAQIRAAQAQPNAPEILYLNEELPPDSLPGLYTACDCLVLPYRGEGFGLPALEGMACGLPVIVTAGGATDDFVRDEFAWRIPSERWIFGREVSGLKLAQAGWLLKPDVAALGRLLREAFASPGEARRRGQLAARHAAKFCSWHDSAAIAAQRIRQLATTALGVPSSGGPVSMPPKGGTPNRTSSTPLHAAPAAKIKITLPPCALVGQLAEARELVRQKKSRLAWEATLAALAKRPFHPEAVLLLAEIAQAVGDGQTAKLCADHARHLAPDWKPAKKFLNQRLKGGARPDWLNLPDALRTPHSALRTPHSALRTPHSALRTRLTVCLIVKNEERFLGQCLQSIRDLASQIVVVDTGSTDRTVEIAREHGAEIHSFAWCDDFSAARNAALEHATGDWVLMLDADEELSAAGRDQLKAAMNQPSVMAWRLPIVDVGREADGCSYVPRFYRNAPGLFYVGRVHEQVFSSIEVRRAEWGLENRIGDATLIHHGYTAELTRDRNKVERNLRLLERAIGELPDEPHLLMNLGLELARSGREAEALARYQEAFDSLSSKPAAEIVPELRETLLTQFCTRLTAAKRFDEVVRALTSPLARMDGGLPASLHFSLGLSHLELRQFSEAADQMRQCLAKRRQRSLAPINPEIHTAAPHHCLALALAKSGSMAAAEKTFQEGLKETGHGDALRLDYARFLAGQNRPVEALQQLHAAVAANAIHLGAWQLGGQIALSQPEFLEFACDWTTAALQHAPQDPLILQQRAETLMLSGDLAAALGLWERVWSQAPHPAALAALILCETVESPTTHAPADGQETAVSQAFIGWYRKLISVKANETIHRLNEQVGKLSRALPGAARLLEAALAEAAPAVTVPT